MFLKSILLFFSTLLLSCGSTENQSHPDSTGAIPSTEETLDVQDLKHAGYLFGTIVHSELENDCPYTIQISGNIGGVNYLDPVNLEETYKKDGQKVWVKFNGLRRMNRCEKAVPVEITDIKKGG